MIALQFFVSAIAYADDTKLVQHEFRVDFAI